jgi:hypothetical protein
MSHALSNQYNNSPCPMRFHLAPVSPDIGTSIPHIQTYLSQVHRVSTVVE